MTDYAVAPRDNRVGVNTYIMEHYTVAALTTGTNKHQWIAPFNLRIVDVIVNSEAGGSGGTSTIVDVNRNGTTIYTTQANRPTLLLADTGQYAEAPDATLRCNAGDVIAYDIDQITSTGPTLTTVTVVCEGL